MNSAVSVIYRNSTLANNLSWSLDEHVDAGNVACKFLRSESDLLRLARVAPVTVAELESFLAISANRSIVVQRSAGGLLLVSAEDAGESLLITGKTAQVLGCYIDSYPVTTQDRSDMTLRRQANLSG